MSDASQDVPPSEDELLYEAKVSIREAIDKLEDVYRMLDEIEQIRD